ncbi:dipeptidase [Corallococcus carmarthensis]|uniref:Membrane dipeptidase n=1 Tax=Corallococcus carmarthensis TaxID=2316728 RepID=A0A3A8K4N9_9BACT|nr:dipeptidase [Corallococcus carmarthensis]NOK16434.1 membrane dipeptidase [Corallococcus carmarthensis]RKG99314.1 membrane dipeptidase [Corallococcus carmarthensis]
MRPTSALLSLVLLAAPACTHGTNVQAPLEPAERARLLARRVIIADGHVDVPYRLHEALGPDGAPTEDISQRTTGGDFDYPRAVEGGFDVAFMSIYIPAELQKSGGAKALADSLIDMMEKVARDAPDKFAMAPSVEVAERNSQAGKISFALGIENGAAIEDRLENLRHFQQRGVRYITLTHTEDNLISDSAASQGHGTWNGLSPFGKQVVAEMNRLGIMVDVAHLSDDAIRQAVDLSQLPVIASHSSCRQFTPGYPRNLPDELIRAIAARGGVVMINFGSSFLIPEVQVHNRQFDTVLQAYAKEHGLTKGSPEIKAFIDTYLRDHPIPLARVEDVANHIDHVVKLVGIDHVGLGSDFDGVGPSLPTGLKDVSQYPNLFRVLLERGYSETDIEKIASGNVFRVWRQVEAYAATSRSAAR